MKTTATLVGVFGDQVGFADMIGETGRLSVSKEGGSFGGFGNEWLEFHPKRVTRKDGQIRVRTELGNTFVFDTKENDNHG